METLPNELYKHIIDKLPFTSLFACKNTNNVFNTFCEQRINKNRKHMRHIILNAINKKNGYIYLPQFKSKLYVRKTQWFLEVETVDENLLDFKEYHILFNEIEKIASSLKLNVMFTYEINPTIINTLIKRGYKKNKIHGEHTYTLYF
jgi:hypothetical protein